MKRDFAAKYHCIYYQLPLYALRLHRAYSGVPITVVTRPSESYKEQDRIKACMEYLQSSVTVIQRSKIHQKFILIDNRLVWYGSINLLSYSHSEESIMRLESRELATELALLMKF